METVTMTDAGGRQVSRTRSLPIGCPARARRWRCGSLRRCRTEFVPAGHHQLPGKEL